MAKTITIIGTYTVGIIIVLESLVIGMLYYAQPEAAMWFLFVIAALSILLGLFPLLDPAFYSTGNRGTTVIYLCCIMSTLVYSALYRENIRDAVFFISTIMFMYYVYCKGLNNTSINLLLCCNILLVIVHIIGAQRQDAFEEFCGRTTLVSVWGNPNMAGIAVTSTLLLLVTGIFYVRRSINRLLFIILSLLCIILLLYTCNRGSLLSVVMLIIMLIINSKSYKDRKMVRLLLILSPIIVGIVYVSVSSLFSSDMMFFGKSVLTRPGWELVITEIIRDPVGISKLPESGLNMAIAGMIEYGILGMGSFFLLLLWMKPKYAPENKLGYQQVAYLAFLCVFLQQAFENTLTNGAYGLYIHTYLLLGIANTKTDNLPSVTLEISKFTRLYRRNRGCF